MTSIITLRKRWHNLNISHQNAIIKQLLLCHVIKRIEHACSCIIEFIKLVAKKRLKARQASHFIAFSTV